MKDKEQEIYLDNAATTRVCDSAAKAVLGAMQNDFGNPSSKHVRGLDAEKIIKNAARTIAETLDVKPSEIVFTSGGTESNNTALIGAALAAKRRIARMIDRNADAARRLLRRGKPAGRVR